MASKKWEKEQLLIGRIQAAQRALEETKAVKAYRDFKRLPIEQQGRLRGEWDAYYRAVKETPFYALLQQQIAAARKRDWKKLAELADEVKKMAEAGDCIVLEKPAFHDPDGLEKHPNVVTWIKNDKRIKELFHITSKELTVDDIFS